MHKSNYETKNNLTGAAVAHLRHLTYKVYGRNSPVRFTANKILDDITITLPDDSSVILRFLLADNNALSTISMNIIRHNENGSRYYAYKHDAYETIPTKDLNDFMRTGSSSLVESSIRSLLEKTKE